MTLTIERFLAMSSAKGPTLHDYRVALDRLQGLAGKPLGDCGEEEVIRIKENLRARDNLGAAHDAQLLRMYFTRAQKPELAQLLRLKIKGKKLAPGDVLTPEEVRSLMRVADNRRDAALVVVLWETGTRVHEVCALKVGSVKPLPDGSGYGLWFGKVKVAGEEHVGYVRDMAPILKGWLEDHPFKDPGAPLFPNFSAEEDPDAKDGRSYARTPVGGATVWRVLHRLKGRAGLEKKLYPHLFRHSRATDLLRQGMSPLDVKRLLGWTPGSGLLESKYQHLAQEDSLRALERLGKRQGPVQARGQEISKGGLYSTGSPEGLKTALREAFLEVLRSPEGKEALRRALA